MECKAIGPSSKCFCDHRYKDHNYLNPKEKRVHCKVPKCPCFEFCHIPVRKILTIMKDGSQDFKCICKHSNTEHDPVTKKCKRAQCACNKFGSSFSCSCGQKYSEHINVFETVLFPLIKHDERVRMGKPVDNIGRMIKEHGAPHGFGGLTNFTDLVQGSERFENMNEKMLEDQRQNFAINDQDQKRLENKKGKLGNLNSKLSAGKDNEYDVSQGVMKAYGKVMGRPTESISALELFMTPHLYCNSKPKGAKALKFK